MAQVLGATSATTKNSVTLSDGGRDHAPPAEEPAGEHAEEGRLHELGGQHEEQRGVEPLLVLDQRRAAPGPARPLVSARAWALACDDAGERRLGDGEDDRAAGTGRRRRPTIATVGGGHRDRRRDLAAARSHHRPWW